MDVENPYLVATQVSCSDNSLLQTVQYASLYSLPLIKGGSSYLAQVVHRAEALSVLEDIKPEWLHNIIVDVFHTVLEGTPMFSQYDISQLKP